MIQVNAASPVNWQHPLNLCLRAWFLAGVQGRTGGATWFDLVQAHRGLLNVAVANGMVPVSDWVGTRRVGGFGALEFDGENDVVEIPKTLSVKGQTAATIAAWFKPASAPVGNAGLYYESQLSAGSTRFAIFHLTTGFIQGAMRQANGTQFTVNDTAALTNGVWYHLCLTVDADTERLVLYRDGKQVAINTTAKTGFATDDPGSEINIGRYTGSSSAVVNGQVDDVRLWHRGLSATEVKAYYDLSRQGYPGLLNRIEPIVAFVPTAPAAGMLHTNLSGNLQTLFGGMQN